MPVTSVQQTKSITHAMCSDVGDDPVLNKLIFFTKRLYIVTEAHTSLRLDG